MSQDEVAAWLQSQRYEIQSDGLGNVMVHLPTIDPTTKTTSYQWIKAPNTIPELMEFLTS